MQLRITIFFIVISSTLFAQKVPVVITNATLHIGNGTVIENGLVIIQDGILQYAGPNKESGYNDNTATLIDATGKHVYPGIIAMHNQLGLKEVEAVRSTRDAYEVGQFNPNVRSIIAYNTDSKVIPTLRTNGILLAQVIPDGGIISGQSSVVKLSGWNWEDAAIKMDNGMHLVWPGYYRYDYKTGSYKESESYINEVIAIKNFFAEAEAYCNTETHATKNLRFEAMRKIFSGDQKLFINANDAKQIIGVVDFTNMYKLNIVLVGGRQSYRVLDLLKENKIPVLLQSTHELPAREGDIIDLPYKLPAILLRAGIECGLSISNEGGSYWNMRNLPFDAGTAVAYGLTKEEALKMITLTNAKFLGIEKNYGTLETGKSATLFISEGDVLDMRTSRLTNIYINGEKTAVGNWQTDLSKKYEQKYGIEIK